jgi:dihydrodipicolinate synthase/N-acetylneuraminate lyase
LTSIAVISDEEAPSRLTADLVRGRELWAKTYPICRLLEAHNCAAVKTGMQLRGYETGPVRKLFALLEGEARPS